MKGLLIKGLFLGLFSCIQPRDLFFAEAYPSSCNEISVPKKLIGNYSLPYDSSELIITDSSIIIISQLNAKAHSSQPDSLPYGIRKDSTFLDGKEEIKIKFSVDSIYQQTIHYDTVFFNSNWFKLCHHKGFYFANRKVWNHQWIVRILQVTKNGILVSQTKSKEDVESLPDYSRTESDSIRAIDLKDYFSIGTIENENLMLKMERKFYRISKNP